MDPTRLTCPFCGFELEAEDTACHHGCPLRRFCGLTRCPSCDYEMPRGATGQGWLRLLPWRRRERCRRSDGPIARTVTDLRPGETARVVGLDGASDSRRGNLAVFGVVPGAEIELLLDRPAFVVRLDETEIALDRQVARSIVIETLPPRPPAQRL